MERERERVLFYGKSINVGWAVLGAKLVLVSLANP